MDGSSGALRLTLLVCAAVASGYLWRAALESPSNSPNAARAPEPLRQPATRAVPGSGSTAAQVAKAHADGHLAGTDVPVKRQGEHSHARAQLAASRLGTSLH